jgi:hypothetical protein
MMNRRAVLAMVGKTVAGGASLSSSLAASSWLSAIAILPPPAEAQTPTAFEAQLQADMTLLAKRVYSEEGIPMILGCEDLTAKTPVAPASLAMNRAVAPAFHKYVEAWQHLHPDAPVGDVAKLLELLAYRDFAGGGKDTNL